MFKKKGDLLHSMLSLANNAHYGQVDKGGKPYILHPIAVMSMLNSNDEELQCIALGHDIIEDTKITAADLYNYGFTDRIVNGIVALTKVKGESYEDYKKKVLASPDARQVKYFDLRHNMDISRLPVVTMKDNDRLIRYRDFSSEILRTL